MNRKNILKQKLKGGNSVIGTWSSLSSPNAISVLGATDLDFVVIDMEHGSMSFETVENMVRAAEAYFQLFQMTLNHAPCQSQQNLSQ
jgi:4-hydroxy-2-oxoheptanedioate aldolase